MATAPDLIRKALQLITGAAVKEVRAVSQQAPSDPAEWRAALFATAPLIVSEYAPAAASLSLDWFEEIRDEAAPKRLFTPTPRLLVTDDDVAATVARTTEALRNPDREFQDIVDRLMAEAEAALEAEVQRQVASGFWDTTTGNANDDRDAVGWRRFARPGACKFCLLLAGRGEVYTQGSVRFKAHTNCHCVVAPSYDHSATEATFAQYTASRRKRSAADKARLREYLNHNFPDAPG